MYESLIASCIFWAAFAFSAGPFWTAIMEEARHNDFASIYKNYIWYLLIGWLPLIATIGVLVGTLGGIHSSVIDALYFIGAAVILYYAWKVLRKGKSTSGAIDFNWQSMVIVSWSNPKVWLIIPGGFLSANYTDWLAVNILIFYSVSLPMFLLCVYLWGTLGRQGAKISRGAISYFNAFLLCCFAFYLLYEGISKHIE